MTTDQEMDTDDGASISSVQTVLPAYAQHTSDGRPTSPTPSYRTIEQQNDSAIEEPDLEPESSVPSTEPAASNSRRYSAVDKSQKASPAHRKSNFNFESLRAHVSRPTKNLVWALEREDFLTVNSIVEDQAKRRIIDPGVLKQAFAKALDIGDWQTFQTLLSEHRNGPFPTSGRGGELLHSAIKDTPNERRHDLARWLLLNGVDPNIRGGLDDIPLDEAISRSDIKMIILLLEFGADANAQHILRRGESFLHCLIKYANDPESIALQSMLNQGANVQAVDFTGQTPLHAAADVRENTTQVLIDAGADVNARDPEAMTPLHFAASVCHQGVASRLIDHGALLNTQSTEGKTPLHLALLASRERDSELSMAFFLLRHGASTTIADKHRTTATVLFISGISGPAQMTRLFGLGVKLSLSAWWRLLARDDTFAAAIISVALEKNPGLVHVKDTNGSTCLHILARNDRFVLSSPPVGSGPFTSHPMAKTLMLAGADLEARDDFRHTPLLIAASFDRVTAVRNLLKASANREAKDMDGHTPLHLSVRFTCWSCLNLLLEAGVNVNAVTEDGATAYSIANTIYGTREKWLLKQFGADTELGTTMDSDKTYYSAPYTAQRKAQMERNEQQRLRIVEELRARRHPYTGSGVSRSLPSAERRSSNQWRVSTSYHCDRR